MAKLSYSIGKDLGTLSVNPSKNTPLLNWSWSRTKNNPLTVLNGTCEPSFQPGIGVTNVSGRRSWKRRWHFQNSTSTRALFGKDVQHESLRCPKKKSQNIWVPQDSSTVCLCLSLHGETIHAWVKKQWTIWGFNDPSSGACLNPGSQWENHHRWILTILRRHLC